MPVPAPNIALEVFTPPNNSPVGDITQKRDSTPIQCQPYQRKQWIEAIW